MIRFNLKSCRATHVPVGEDQKQHLELARDIADTFNRTFTKLFPLPEYVASEIHLIISVSTPPDIRLAPTRRVLSLKDPTSKMSKSAPDVSSRILLTDTEKEIRTKIRGAVTDSIKEITYDPENRPGTSNLLSILSACVNEDPTSLAERYKDTGHGRLKADVADAVDQLLEGPRTEFERLRGEDTYLSGVARQGAEEAITCSAITMQGIRKAVGLY